MRGVKEQQIGKIYFSTDTRKSTFGFLGAIDIQLNAAIVDCFYLLCLKNQYGPWKDAAEYGREYGLETLSIEFSNPFEWKLLLRNVSKFVTTKTAREIADRTIYFESESRKRLAQAELIEQDVVTKKIKNLERANKLRQQILRGNISSPKIEETLDRLMQSQQATLRSIDD